MYFNTKSLLSKRVLIISIAVILTTITFFSLMSKKPKLRQIELGAWTQGFFDSKTQTLHPSALIKLEKTIHKNVSIAHFYIGWEKLLDKSTVNDLNTIYSNRWTPMISVNPYYFSGCKYENVPIYEAIADGDCDIFLNQSAKNLSRINKPFFFLFAWEMNNDNNQWSIQYTKTSPKEFINAWRHIYKIFAINNVKAIWVFCPNVPEKNNLSYKSIYPGDKYVDWVGLDGYNWGTTQSWSEFLSFSEIFKSPYERITSISKNKPVMISEFNTTDMGGNKQDWYVNTLSNDIPNEFPKIKAIVIFNEDRTKEENVNWMIDVNDSSLKGFIKGINSGYYY